MKKLSLKINKGLKAALLVSSMALAAWAGTTKSATTLSFIPFALVAGLKKKNYQMDEDEENLMKGIETELNEAMQKQFEGLITKDDLEAEIKKITAKTVMIGEGDKAKSVEDVLRDQGLDITTIKLGGGTEVKAQSNNVAGQIKAYIEANKEAFEAFKRGEAKSFGSVSDKNGAGAGIVISKAPGTMTVAGNTNNSAFVPTPVIEPGLIDLVRNRPFIEQYSNTSAVSSPRVVWTEKTNPEGEAAFIAEGGVKPLIDFEIISRESYAKKVADKIKVSTEMLDDIDFIAAEIESELKYQVDIKVDEELLSGAGDGTSSATTLKGLTQYAGGYVLTNVETTTPNNFDALRASIAQIVSLNFDPTHVFINPIDGANMDLVKDANGRPLAMEYRADGRIYRIQPVETNQMPVGFFLMGDMSRFKVRNYKPFAIYYGWVNDDFEKNLVTIIGERRLHCYVANNHIGAFIYDSFADVKTAITAPQA